MQAAFSLCVKKEHLPERACGLQRYQLSHILFHSISHLCSGSLPRQDPGAGIHGCRPASHGTTFDFLGRTFALGLAYTWEQKPFLNYTHKNSTDISQDKLKWYPIGSWLSTTNIELNECKRSQVVGNRRCHRERVYRIQHRQRSARQIPGLDFSKNQIMPVLWPLITF